ncbi:tyrosine-type recombinase/integrase [Lysinibacillus agricola]
MMKANYPKGDLWELEETNKSSINYGKIYSFDFSFVTSESIKKVIKQYMWSTWKDGKNSLAHLYNNLIFFKNFNRFADQHHIHSFRELTNSHVNLFLSFLNNQVGERTKKPFGNNYKKNCLDVLKAIIRFGQWNLPNVVPTVNIFTGNEFGRINKMLKIDFIPDDVVEQIKQALKKEKNPYIKWGITILQETGMRISELRLLKVDYLQKHPVHGWELKWLDSKKQQLRKPTPINVVCVKAFRQLERYTSELREEADDNTKNYLFLHKARGHNKNPVSVPTHSAYHYWFSSFIKRHNILDSNCELYNLTSHQFRRTLATDMLSKGVELQSVSNLLGHSNASVTWKHYATVKDKERADVFRTIGIIGDINKVDDSIIHPEDRKWFFENKDKGARLRDGYCTKPFEGEEICSTYLKMQKCFGCNRFVTTPQYLDEHKKHLADLEKQVEENREFGEHFVNHYKPTMDVLRDIIKKLEEIKYGQNQTTTSKD